MKVRFVRFFRFQKIKTQDDDETRVALEVPCKRMLCRLTPDEAIQLYNAIDEEYTKVRGLKPFDVVMPKVEEFTEVTNLEMLMGYDRGAGVTENAEAPQEILSSTDGLMFASQSAFEYFVNCVQKYIDKKVKEEVARAKGDLL
jgi:hypothetical protein